MTATRKQSMVGKNILRGVREEHMFGGQNYFKYNKLNKNSENYRGQDYC